MITTRFVEKTMVMCTNQKAAGEGAGTGGTVYMVYVQFDVNEMYCFIGVQLQAINCLGMISLHC